MNTQQALEALAAHAAAEHLQRVRDSRELAAKLKAAWNRIQSVILYLLAHGQIAFAAVILKAFADDWNSTWAEYRRAMRD